MCYPICKELDFVYTDYVDVQNYHCKFFVSTTTVHCIHSTYKLHMFTYHDLPNNVEHSNSNFTSVCYSLMLERFGNDCYNLWQIAIVLAEYGSMVSVQHQYHSGIKLHQIYSKHTSVIRTTWFDVKIMTLQN